MTEVLRYEMRRGEDEGGIDMLKREDDSPLRCHGRTTSCTLSDGVDMDIDLLFFLLSLGRRFRCTCT